MLYSRGLELIPERMSRSSPDITMPTSNARSISPAITSHPSSSAWAFRTDFLLHPVLPCHVSIGVVSLWRHLRFIIPRHIVHELEVGQHAFVGARHDIFRISGLSRREAVAPKLVAAVERCLNGLVVGEVGTSALCWSCQRIE